MPTDVFLILGQSNAQGRAPHATGEVVPGALDVSFGDVRPLGDPVGPACDGSAWPAFARRYQEETGSAVAVVNSAYGAAALLARCDRGMGNWSSAGLLRGVARSAAGRALRALTLRGRTPRLRGIIWAQGEREAVEGVAAARYADELTALISWSREAFEDPGLRWILSLVGAPASGDLPSFAEIRRAQSLVAGRDPLVIVGHTDAVSFPARGWMCDEVHYSAEGYAHMGEALGAAAAGTTPAPAPARAPARGQHPPTRPSPS